MLAIERHLADEALARSGAAVLVVSLDRGDTLYAREADRLYTPASNRKLFTAASALHHLGADYRFITRLVATGSFRGDTLHGDLVLIGSGDPDLETGDLRALAREISSSGVRVVTGDLRYDDSLFDDFEWGPGWMWDDGPFWFWPYISALSVNDNTVTMRVRPGSEPGDPVVVSIDPPTTYIGVENTATTAAAGTESTLEIDRRWSPKENVIDVTGSLPLDADEVEAIRTVEAPARYAATVLGEILSAAGVEILGTIRRAPLDEEPSEIVASHRSDSLAVSVRNLLKISDNLTAEQLVKVVGAVVSDSVGSYETGLGAEAVFLAREVGIDSLALRLADGSGVSRYNLVTARQIVALLDYVDRRSAFGAHFRDALPIAGVDGTLADRMIGTAAEARARAKTGSLSGVSSLSGYVPSATGERLAFSIMMEFFVGSTAPRRAVQDSIVSTLAAFRR